MNPKMQWLRNKMSSLDLQGIIISNPINIKYLTGIDAEGTLLITRKENIYITDGRYIEYVHSTLTLFDEIIVYDIKDVSKDDYENFFMFCENVGFEENYVTYAKYKEYIRKYKINNLVETEYIIEKQRMIKDDEELKDLKIACEITDNCFSYILSYIKPGMTEIEIAREIEEYYRQRTDGLSFETIVASGENTSKPHAVPTDRKIQKQDIITIDMGCKYHGYCSDMTRTFYCKSVDDEQANIHDIVRTAVEKAEAAIKPGARFCDIDAQARDYIDEKGYSEYWKIRLGHFIGQEDHEYGDVSPINKNVAEPGMIFSIEPGIYIEGKYGVRVEDLVLVTEDGHEVLNKVEKKYRIVG